MVKERMGMRFPKLRSESDQLLRLDSLRFIAAVMVVIYHFRNQWVFASGPGWKMARFDSMSLAVDLFFIISRSEEHTSELQSLMRISYAVFCLKKKKTQQQIYHKKRAH